MRFNLCKIVGRQKSERNSSQRSTKQAVIRRRAAASLLGCACVMALSGAARANTVFASFQNADFEFNNTGTASTTGLLSTGTPLQITFQFDESVTGDSITYAANQPIKATATLVSQVAGDVTGTHALDQPLQSGSLEFKDQFGNNLLTLSGFTADLTGFSGGSTANVSTDTTLPTSPDIGTYSSDFLQFAPANDVVASTSLTLELNGTLTAGTDNFINNFTANADGSFSGNAAAIPEPSGLSFAGIAGAGLLVRRKRCPA